MKTLIAIKEQQHSWVSDAFPNLHPLLLPLCNKPFIEYLIDFAILAGCREIRLLSDGTLSEIEEICQTGSRWGIELTYANLRPEDGEQELINKNRKFCADSRTMIISGYAFIDYDKRLDYRGLAHLPANGPIASCPAGSITLAGPPEPATADATPVPNLNITPIDSIRSCFSITMQTLETGADRYVLPDYGSEPGCAIGRNVAIAKTVEIRKPVSIGNNVQLLPGTIIGPMAVIGSNIIIDKGSAISGSIIHDNTYIGEQLEIEGRVASGDTLIDPESGTSLTMEDPHLLAGIRGATNATTLLRKTIHALAAAILILLQALPIIILYPLLKLQGKWKNEPETQQTGQAETLAAKLSLDRFPLLPKVLIGRLAIIGSAPRENCAANKNPGCRPAVFSYAEAEDWPVTGSDAAIVERYHAVHSTPLNDIGMTIKALINRPHNRNAGAAA
jgi:NDP-sugar pyrophosphorylase family protein